MKKNHETNYRITPTNLATDISTELNYFIRDNKGWTYKQTYLNSYDNYKVLIFRRDSVYRLTLTSGEVNLSHLLLDKLPIRRHAKNLWKTDLRYDEWGAHITYHDDSYIMRNIDLVSKESDLLVLNFEDIFTWKIIDLDVLNDMKLVFFRKDKILPMPYVADNEGYLGLVNTKPMIPDVYMNYAPAYMRLDSSNEYSAHFWIDKQGRLRQRDFRYSVERRGTITEYSENIVMTRYKKNGKDFLKVSLKDLSLLEFYEANYFGFNVEWTEWSEGFFEENFTYIESQYD